MFFNLPAKAAQDFGVKITGTALLFIPFSDELFLTLKIHFPR